MNNSVAFVGYVGSVKYVGMLGVLLAIGAKYVGMSGVSGLTMISGVSAAVSQTETVFIIVDALVGRRRGLCGSFSAQSSLNSLNRSALLRHWLELVSGTLIFRICEGLR